MLAISFPHVTPYELGRFDKVMELDSCGIQGALRSY